MTEEQIAKLYDQALVIESNGDYVAGELDLVKFAKMVAEHERNECAKIVELNADACRSNNVAQMILYSNAVAIRARGQRTPEGGEA